MTALILLPGMDGSGALFADFLSCLDPAIKPIVVSYPANQPLGYRELTDFARSYLPANEPFVLLGESFSGPVAIALAAERPAGLAGLILSCTYARNPLPWLQPTKGLIGFVPVSGKLSGLLAPLLFGRFSSAALRAGLRQALARVSAGALRARMRAVLDVNFSGPLKSVHVPILYLQATGDRVVPASASRAVVATGRDVELVAFRGPHLLLQALPDETAKVIGKFIHKAVQDLPAVCSDVRSGTP